MSTKRKVEVFSAGCPACDDAVSQVKKIACSSCEVEILDMHRPTVAAKASAYGIRRIPAVVIDGKLADYCAHQGPDESRLRAAGLGMPI